MTQKIGLGDKVRDSVSGLEGIAVSRTEYLNGCIRIAIQQPVDKDGKLPETQWMDEPQLEVITSQKVTPPSAISGG